MCTHRLATSATLKIPLTLSWKKCIALFPDNWSSCICHSLQKNVWISRLKKDATPILLDGTHSLPLYFSFNVKKSLN